MKGDILLGSYSQRKFYFVLGAQRFKRLTKRYGVLKCQTCPKVLKTGDRVYTKRKASGRWRIWCGKCAVRLLMV